jgi:hypothetical protein
MASGESQIQIEKRYLESRIVVIAHFALNSEYNIGPAVTRELNSSQSLPKGTFAKATNIKQLPGYHGGVAESGP